MDGARLQRPDGYLNGLGKEPDKRWTNLRDKHECTARASHEAAVACTKHRQKVVGYRIAIRGSHRFGFGPEELRGYPGHEEIELALVQAYRATGNEISSSSKFFDDERGQPHYYDAEAERGGDPSLRVRTSTCSVASRKSCRPRSRHVSVQRYGRCGEETRLSWRHKALWQVLTSKHLYIAESVRRAKQGLRLTMTCESAYCETCAAIGLVF